MSDKGQTCRGESTVNRVRSSLRTFTGASVLAAVALGMMCVLLLSVTVYAAGGGLPRGRGTPRGAPRPRLAPAVRQAQRAASIYTLDNPVRLELNVVKVELGAAGNVAQSWRSIAQLFSADSLEAEGLTSAVDTLKSFGETVLLHSGVCVLTSNDATYVNSARTVPVRSSRPTGEGGTVRAVEYRDLARKLIANLEGLDAQGRICFSYDIAVSYVEDETGGTSAAPTFASFNMQARGKVRDGRTLVIQNLDRSTALLVFLTPRIVD